MLTSHTKALAGRRAAPTQRARRSDSSAHGRSKGGLVTPPSTNTQNR